MLHALAEDTETIRQYFQSISNSTSLTRNEATATMDESNNKQTVTTAAEEVEDGVRDGDATSQSNHVLRKIERKKIGKTKMTESISTIETRKNTTPSPTTGSTKKRPRDQTHHDDKRVNGISLTSISLDVKSASVQDSACEREKREASKSITSPSQPPKYYSIFSQGNLKQISRNPTSFSEELTPSSLRPTLMYKLPSESVTAVDNAINTILKSLIPHFWMSMRSLLILLDTEKYSKNASFSAQSNLVQLLYKEEADVFPPSHTIHTTSELNLEFYNNFMMPSAFHAQHTVMLLHKLHTNHLRLFSAIPSIKSTRRNLSDMSIPAGWLDLRAVLMNALTTLMPELASDAIGVVPQPLSRSIDILFLDYALKTLVLHESDPLSTSQTWKLVWDIVEHHSTERKIHAPLRIYQPINVESSVFKSSATAVSLSDSLATAILGLSNRLPLDDDNCYYVARRLRPMEPAQREVFLKYVESGSFLYAIRLRELLLLLVDCGVPPEQYPFDWTADIQQMYHQQRESQNLSEGHQQLKISLPNAILLSLLKYWKTSLETAIEFGNKLTRRTNTQMFESLFNFIQVIHDFCAQQRRLGLEGNAIKNNNITSPETDWNNLLDQMLDSFMSSKLKYTEQLQLLT